MAGRLVRSEDFERVLAQPARARSAHFAVHFACGTPHRPIFRAPPPELTAKPELHKLSTEGEPVCQQAVDDLRQPESAPGFGARVWLGTVVPKRHARRAVTRTLIKRQIRSAARRLGTDAHRLEPGLWVVRLRAAFERAEFASAASAALRNAARQELDALLLQCSVHPKQPANPRSR